VVRDRSMPCEAMSRRGSTGVLPSGPLKKDPERKHFIPLPRGSTLLKRPTFFHEYNSVT